MSEPTLYRIEPDAATTGQQIRAVDDAIQDGVLVPVEEPAYRIDYSQDNSDGAWVRAHTESLIALGVLVEIGGDDSE